MIQRYTRPDMAAIWDPQTRYRIWFEIEAHAADAMAKLGMIPKSAAKKIRDRGRNAKFDIDRIDAIEREVKHDVIAFLTHLAEIVGRPLRSSVRPKPVGCSPPTRSLQRGSAMSNSCRTSFAAGPNWSAGIFSDVTAALRTVLTCS